ncbi:MAG: Gfo/Idh/MocA family oxidoreductase [bacterium]|nr:Gfo/Idh/MocA family oxidoreductase [bacterium]
MASLSTKFSKIRVGIVGCGGISGLHFEGYKQNGARIIACADVNEAAARTRANQYDCVPYTDYQEMLAKEQLDVISICTPPAFHKEIAIHALKKKIHVLCEKPLAMNVAEAKAMVVAAKKYQVLLMTAFCHRFQTPIVAMKKLIDSGKLGTVLMFRNRFAGKFHNVDQVWFSNPKLAGGGVFMDTLVHSVDIFRYFFGEVASVSGKIHTFNKKIKVEDVGIMLLKSKSNVIGTVEASWATPISEAIVEVYGSEGTAIYSYNKNELRYWLAKDKEWQRPKLEVPSRFTLEIEDFLKAVATGSKLRVDGIDGLRALEVIEKAYKTAKNICC